MSGHFLLTAYRSLTRRPGYAALNIIGLALGIAVFLLLWLNVRFETSFETWIPGARDIYLVRTAFAASGASQGASNRTMGATLDALKADFPQLVGTRDVSMTSSIRQGGSAREEQIEAVDPNFFEVFELPLVAGDRATALGSPDSLLLTLTKARQYFGSDDPMGRRLAITTGGETHEYRVTGVLRDLPRQTDLKFDFLVPLTPQTMQSTRGWTTWGTSGALTYLRFDRAADADALSTNLENFVLRHAPDKVAKDRKLRLKLQPLRSMHLLNPKDAAVVGALGAVGLLTALLAGINYVNLATASAGLRAREIALRKVSGAARRVLFVQFMAESVMTAALAALIGLGLCELALPLINLAGGLDLKLEYWGAKSVLPFVLAGVAMIGLGAGLYPAWVLSGYQPAAVLASARAPGGGRAGSRLREGLVVVQFAIAIAFIIGTFVIVNEAWLIRHADPGYRRDGLLVVNSFEDPQLTADERTNLLAAWRATSGFVGVTAGSRAPGDTGNAGSFLGFRRTGSTAGPSLVEYIYTSPDFFSTYNAPLLAGRVLSAEDGIQKPPHNVVLNTTAVRNLGFKDPHGAVGQTLNYEADGGSYSVLVVGVVQDMRFHSAKEPIQPALYLLHTRADEFLPGTDDYDERASIRYSGADWRVAEGKARDVWLKMAPDTPFVADTAESQMASYYMDQARLGRLLASGALMAVIIACVGLFGLASFGATSRTREIGIRKTLGASTRDVLVLVLRQILRPVVVANLIAWPLAFVVMRNWLAGFDQRVPLSPAYFLTATAAALLVACLTVLTQAWRLARAEPAKALRHD